MRLPIGTLNTPGHEDAAVSADHGPSASRRVLIADDNHDSADSLAMLLRLEGHDVMTVHDGTQALAAYATFEPECVLLDIGMPGLSGYEVARWIRRQSSSEGVMLVAAPASRGPPRSRS